jgi:hypothetical protein
LAIVGPGSAQTVLARAVSSGAMPAVRWASSTASGTARMLAEKSGMKPSHGVSRRVKNSLRAATGGASMVSGAWISTPIFTPSCSASGSSRDRIGGPASMPTRTVGKPSAAAPRSWTATYS